MNAGSPGRTLVAAVLMVGLVPLPLGAAHDGCDGMTAGGYVVIGSPLSEQASASQLSFMLLNGGMGHALRHLGNGVDTLVIDLGCSYTGAAFALQGTDHGNDLYDLAVTFLDARYLELDRFADPDSPDVSGAVPSQSRYAVVHLLEGAPVAGFTPFPPKPYSASVTLLVQT